MPKQVVFSALQISFTLFLSPFLVILSLVSNKFNPKCLVFPHRFSDSRKNPHIRLDHPRCGFFYISFEKSFLAIRSSFRLSVFL